VQNVLTNVWHPTVCIFGNFFQPKILIKIIRCNLLSIMKINNFIYH